MTIQAPARAARPIRSGRSVGWVPFALVALVAIPAIAGAFRLVELAGGPPFLPANPRLNASPLPVVVHIVSAIAYAILGAFQFSAALRRRPGASAGGVAGVRWRIGRRRGRRR